MSSDPEGGPPLLDPAALEDLTRDDDGRALLARLTGIFTRDSRSRVEEIGKLLDAGEPEGVRAVAHSLRGSAASVGAGRLAQACGEVEQSAAAGDLDGASDSFRAMGDLTERTIAALQQRAGGPD